jgi:ABC-2 type transport system permease protein
MSNIIGRLFFHHRAFLITSAALLGLFQIITAAIISSMNLPSAFEQFLAFAPPAIRAMVEQTMPGGSAASILAFTWNHPATHALVMAVAITLAARAIAGEVENGVIELVLAQPISRIKYFASHLTFAMLSIAMVAIVGLLGGILGQVVFGLPPFALGRLLRLLISLFLLQMSFYSLTLLFSSFGREAGRVAVLGVLAAIVSYLVNVIAMLWNKAAFMKPYSLHTYYDPRTILVDGHLTMSSVILLGVFALTATAGAFARFLTRDLP